jgi:hypothetical protein
MCTSACAGDTTADAARATKEKHVETLTAFSKVVIAHPRDF